MAISTGAIVGRIFVLLILIIILAIGGVFWFDYLNVIDAKTVLAPVYAIIPFAPGAGRTGTDPLDGEILNIDAERFAILVEALDLRTSELANLESDLQLRYGEVEQMAQEISERQRAQDDREKTFNDRIRESDDRERNIEQIANFINSMPPASGVAILSNMDDQDVIDVLRMTEQMAQAQGNASLVSVWLSQMDPVRSAEISRKMVSRPPSLF